MFYSQFILAKKGPLGTIWIAAHLERKLRKNQVTETNISVSVDSILFPEVPIALRLSGHLLLGVVRIYSRKVNYLFHDCSEALVKIKQAFHAGAVDLPPEAATAPFHSITLPETFDLDEFEPLPDREMHLLHSNGAVDHHVTTREQITLQDPLEDNSYLESQFGLDERFPEGDVPRMGIDFDEDLLEKPAGESSPDALALEEELVIPTTMDPAIDYDQMDRMEGMDVDDHHEPGTPALGIDHMDMDYQPDVDVMEHGDLDENNGVFEQLEPDLQQDHLELEDLEGVKNPDQLEPATPGAPEPVHVDKEEEGHEQEVEENSKNFDAEEQIEKQKEEDIEENLDVEEIPAETETAEKQDEVEIAGQPNEEGNLGEDEELNKQETDKVMEDFQILRHEDGKEDQEKEEVVEYETVMSVVEVANHEPDVFDLDHDMELERSMPTVDVAGKDGIMEEMETVLVEETVDVMQENQQLISELEPVSPASPPLPTISSDCLPGDDDVLGSLLGRGTPALKVIPTPVGSLVGKLRKKPGQRKRKILMDMTTILPAEVMREQLMNTDDIRRVRRKAPCSRQELWSVQKDALGQQLFCEHAVPGLCGELRAFFERVYVSGEANLPLADAVQVGVTINEEVPEPQGELLVDDIVAERNKLDESVETPELDSVDNVIQEAADEYLQLNDVQALNVAMNEPLEVQIVVRPEFEGGVCPTPVAEQQEPPSTDLVETTCVEQDESRAADNDVKEEASNEEGMEFSVEESKPVDLPSQSPELEEAQATEEVPDLPSEMETTLINEQMSLSNLFMAVDETESKAKVEGAAEDINEAEAIDVAVTEDVVEAATWDTVEERGSEEPRDQDEKLPVLDGIQAVVSSPGDKIEASLNEEQGPNEELGFLADSRDTVFLAADDDDLCEEAEDFQDSDEFGRKETLVQDNSGWSARTRAVGHYLRTTLESKDIHMRKRGEEGTPKLGLEQILLGKSRKESARMFFETLVLKTKDYIHVEQEYPYSDIQISARPKLLKAHF